MNSNHKYEMVNLIVDPEIMRFVGREVGTDRPVVVHLMLRGYTEENKQLLQKLSRAGQDFRSYVVETGEYEHVPYVVTQYFAESLREWLAKIPDESPTAWNHSAGGHDSDFTLIFEEPRTQASQPAGQMDVQNFGEFTMVFQAPELSCTPDPMEGATSDGPGEFTKLFNVPSARVRNAPEPAMKPEVEPRSSAAAAPRPPGESVALFRASAAARPTPPEIQPPPVSQAQPADVEQAPQARQVQPWAAKKPGDFTDAFGPELQPQGRYSELKAKPNPLAVIEGWRGIDLHPAEPPPTASPIPALSGVDGPGEYARIVQARQAPVKASSAPAKPPPSARERSYVPLMVVIGCLMAVALLVVLFLVLQTT